jgi:hypothetical protein
MTDENAKKEFPKDDWEFNVLGINNYRRFSFKKKYYEFIQENILNIEGDIIEAGVYRGRSLLATAMLLKDLGSSKKVYGYDSFCGFPPCYHESDKIDYFDVLLEHGLIAPEHYENIRKNKSYAALTKANPLHASTSLDFADANLDVLERKIDYFDLDNIILVKGAFQESMVEGNGQGPRRVMACLMDCDLYHSYRVALPYVWNRLSQGGYIYLDEYYSLKFPGARLASEEFFKDKNDKPQRHVTAPGDFQRWFVRKLS